MHLLRGWRERRVSEHRRGYPLSQNIGKAQRHMENVGFDSVVCTWKWCRTRLGMGEAVQVLIDGVEHRLCSKHHSEYMNGGEDAEIA